MSTLISKDTYLIVCGAFIAITLGIVTHLIIGDKVLENKNFQKGSWACTTDVMICPNGSTVNRTPPYCHFAACAQ